MTTWKDKLISLFIPDIKPVVIGYDDDKLLTEESIVAALKRKGFSIVLSNSLVQVRYEFEKHLDDVLNGETNKTLLIIHQDEKEFSIPYDVTKNAIRVNVSFDNLFPNLSSAVLHLLTTEQFSDVYDAYEDEKPNSQLGYDRTCLFLLKNLFRIHPQELKTDNDLIALLLKIHFEGVKIPGKLGEYFAQYMNKRGKYTSWRNLAGLLTDSSCFWAYLQSAWDNTLFDEQNPTFGPSKIDFTRNNISIYIDDVFEMGLMQIKEVKASTARPDLIPEKLFELGQSRDSKDRLKQERSKKLLKQLDNEIPSEDATRSDWVTYQKAYSEYMYLNFNKDNSRLFDKVNPIFIRWIEKHYDALSFETGKTPILLPKVVDYLKREKNHGSKKIALIVMDGMSYSQWFAIKSFLSKNDSFVFEEDTSVACIPTLTSISRQSIFSGLYPKYYSSSIYRTSEEPKLWDKAWSDICTPFYLINEGTRSTADDVINQIPPSNQVVGIVINIIDELMHGSILGNADFYGRIDSWMENFFLSDLLIGLMAKDYNVWITSDHGNIEATGIGSIRAGKLPDTKGSRTYIMPSLSLRNQIVAENEFAIPWDSSLLPQEGFSALVAKGSYAFVHKDDRVISHGGISIDEVMVPFVRVQRNEK